jgi:hypothetical protein
MQFQHLFPIPYSLKQTLLRSRVPILRVEAEEIAISKSSATINQ